MKNNNHLQASELMEIMSRQIKSLDELDLNNKNSLKEISRAKEIFNGAGKMIKLSQYMFERKDLTNSLLPEKEYIDKCRD